MKEDFDLGKRDYIRLGPNMVLSAFGGTFHFWAVDMQENLYGRPNIWQGVAESLEEVMGMRPDFFTSFGAPLVLMQLTQTIGLLGQMSTEKLNRPDKTGQFRVFKYLAPVAVAAVFTAYELSGLHISGMEYADNPMVDNMATLGALGISLITGLASERIKKGNTKP